MTARLIFAAAIVALLPLCVSCSHPDAAKVRNRHSVVRLLDRADTMLGTNDSAALAALDSIDATVLSGRKLSARYALLYSEAMYKNYITAPDDSLIMVAVRYYSFHKDILYGFRSYYTLGCIYNEMERYNDAVLALSEAERYIDEKIISQHRMGQLYSQIGTVYFNTYMYSKAEECFNMSVNFYDSAGKERYRMYSLFDIARCKFELQDYENSYSLFKDILNWSIANSEDYLISDCLKNMMSCSIYSNNVEDLRIILDKLTSDPSIPNDDVYLMTSFAHYYLLLNDYDEAQKIIDRAWGCSLTSDDSVRVLYVNYRIQKGIENFESALSLFEQAISYQNRDLRPVLQHSALSIQNDYYHNLAELESIKAIRRSYAIIIIILISLLLITIGILYHSYNKQKLKSKIDDCLSTISDLTEQNRTSRLRITQLDSELKDLSQTNESSNRIVEQLNNKVRELFSNQYASLDKLYQEIIRIQDIKNINTATFLKRINKYVKDIVSKDNQKKLDKIINETYSDLMVRISNSDFHISESDMTMLRLLLIGYSVKTVGVLTDNTPENVYQKRYRIVGKISRSSESLAEELRKALSMND